jgi:hypothetical protein
MEHRLFYSCIARSNGVMKQINTSQGMVSSSSYIAIESNEIKPYISLPKVGLVLANPS